MGVIMEIVLRTLKGLKALQQRGADSTNNMHAENDDKVTDSDENVAQNQQNSCILMLIAHKNK
jgi:hypothetical protein